MKEKDNIVDELSAHANEIRALGVRRIGIFGSFVRNQQNKTSDLDLLVEFDDGKKSFDNYISLSYFLERLLNLPVEIVTPESLSPYIGPYILKEVEYVNLPN